MNILKETKQEYSHYLIECECCSAVFGTGDNKSEICAKCFNGKDIRSLDG